jgi:hypothetical protein
MMDSFSRRAINIPLSFDITSFTQYIIIYISYSTSSNLHVTSTIDSRMQSLTVEVQTQCANMTGYRVLREATTDGTSKPSCVASHRMLSTCISFYVHEGLHMSAYLYVTEVNTHDGRQGLRPS